MKDFYQDLVTQASWDLFVKLRKEINCVLIGGWAVYLYTSALKSKDIDIIIDFSALDRLKQKYDVNKNEHLRKYEIKREGIDIDIYVPYYSVLALPVEEILKFSVLYKKINTIKKELLLILKQRAYFQRKAAVKGQKDKVDIISLVRLPDFDFAFYRNILKKYQLENYLTMLRDILKETKEVPELSLNQHQFSRLKKEILKHV